MSPLDTIAIAMLDGDCKVLQWSRPAAELLNLESEEVCGQPVWSLLANAADRPPEKARIPAVGRAWLRHGSGSAVDVTYRVVQLEFIRGSLVLAVPTRYVTQWEQSLSLMRTLFSQEKIGFSLYDTDLRLMHTNISPEMVGGRVVPSGSRLRDVIPSEDADDIEATLREVLDTGEPVVRKEQPVRSASGRQRTLSLSTFRLEDAKGCPTGIATAFFDATQQHRARRHLELLHEASTRIGNSLDVIRTAQNLADVLVPAIGDIVAVELAESVLTGEEPPKFFGGGQLHLRRTAVAAASGAWPDGLLKPGETVPAIPDSPTLHSLQHGRIVVGDRERVVAMLNDPQLIQALVPEGGHSRASAPLFARGLMLGVLQVWRTEQPDPFDAEDAKLLNEITTRAALSVDNARRYTRDHRAALALQQRLLPPSGTDTAAAQTAGFYIPAGGGAEISGDWFDVLPLPSLRVALVVGDVIGHGLHATVTMGRLRTAIQTLADLELDPEELLSHINNLVHRLADEAPSEIRDTVGATCLYAVYDPVTCSCTLASAGHPSPVVVRPAGTTQLIEISPGPPLGVAELPFESTTIELEPGSVLALYTDGLLLGDDHDIGSGLLRLTDSLAARCRPDRALDVTGAALLRELYVSPPRDDLTLLLARTAAIPTEQTVQWEFPADPSIVADAREAIARQLALWGLAELTFSTELIVSELVTNAIRYAGGPVVLRLIRENALVCEVTDPSATQPRLRRARWTDEGGRGLFLVAQLSTRWGCRYERPGKTIWTEQPIAA
ncbi:SpoIIE family protein phosphatase [Streptomyces sp. NPDC054962]